MSHLIPPRSRDDFRIAIICALPLEASLVEAVLDTCWENEGRRYGKAAGDENAYTTGSMGGHNVVLAYMPGMGSNGAAATAVSLRMSFRAVELALVVGICGAVPVHPTTKEEILLGDCIISTAVIQYDFGRQYPGRFAQKSGIEDSLGRASPGIRALTSKLSGRFGRQRIADRLGRHLKLLQSQAPEAIYPGADKDRLYDSSYIHAHKNSNERCDQCFDNLEICSKDCVELCCDPSHLIARKRLARQDTDQEGSSTNPPRLHIGRFGSANTVMKSGEDRDHLAAVEQIIAFEMEGAGVWNYCPTVVIKAVCDYADSHKNKVWQNYAAAAAVACTKAFLEEWTVADEPSNRFEQLAIHDTSSYVESRSMPEPLKPVWHVPFCYKDGFIGRATELQRLRQSALGHDGDRLSSIIGLGGMGKSRLALELAHLVQTEQPSFSIFWVQATNHSTFEKDIRDIGVKIEIPGIHDEKADVKALVKQRLSDPTAGRWLLIIDNADDEGIWSRSSKSSDQASLVPYLPQARHGFVLVTTRSRRVAVGLGGRAVVNLQSPSKDEAYRMLANELDSDHAHIVADRSLTSTLLEKLDFLPLAIVQAASFLNMTQESVETYLSLLDQPESEVVDLLSQDFGDPLRYPDARNPVAMTWLVSFDHIRQHDPLAATCLSAMACLHYKSIPHSLLPEAQSKIDWVRAMGMLTGYSFVTRQATANTSNEVGDLYDMHRLVHLATRNWLKMEGSFACYVAQSIVRLARLFPQPIHENRKTWTVYLPHCERLFLEDSPTSLAERYELMDDVAACKTRDGKYGAALAMCSEVVKWRETELGPDDGQTLSAYSSLGEALYNHGDWRAAETYLSRAYREMQMNFGVRDHRTLVTQYRLGRLYMELDRRQEAEELVTQVAEAWRQILGPEARLTLKSLDSLSTIYWCQGRETEARELNLQILDTQNRVLGPEHPDTLRSLANLATSYFYQEQCKEAEKQEVHVSEVSTRVLGSEHPTTPTSLSNSVYTSEGQSGYQYAEKLMMRVLEGRKRVLGPEHPDTIMCLVGLATNYWYQNRLEEAQDLELQVLSLRRRVLGSEHPRTIESMVNLARTYWDQDKIQKAAELEAQVLSISTRVRGPEHPATLEAQFDLAETLWMQGRAPEAIDLLSRCADAQAHVLGEEHEETVRSRQTLQSWQEKLDLPDLSSDLDEEFEITPSPSSDADGHQDLIESPGSAG